MTKLWKENRYKLMSFQEWEAAGQRPSTVILFGGETVFTGWWSRSVNSHREGSCPFYYYDMFGILFCCCRLPPVDFLVHETSHLWPA